MHPSDQWREDFRSYGAQWGFRPGSGIDRLMDFVRDEYRAKYGVDYRLRRIGKNRFVAVPGDQGDFGRDYLIGCASRFNTTVTLG